MITAAGEALVEFTRNIPDGVVAFFPSYDFLETCMKAWKSIPFSTSNNTIWTTFEDTKPVFYESKSTTSQDQTQKAPQGESLLSSFTAAVRSGRGALLLAVISGSLSEGINFSDELGRGVVVFGLPYPNIHSAQWKAKMEHVSKKVATASGLETSSRAVAKGKDAARELYENATMRAVNQAVGRAIRHRGDYAAVMLIDRRYATERVQKKLPGWMKASIKKPAGVTEAVVGLKHFFGEKRNMRR